MEKWSIRRSCGRFVKYRLHKHWIYRGSSTEVCNEKAFKRDVLTNYQALRQWRHYPLHMRLVSFKCRSTDLFTDHSEIGQFNESTIFTARHGVADILSIFSITTNDRMENSIQYHVKSHAVRQSPSIQRNIILYTNQKASRLVSRRLQKSSPMTG
jgi:hypothetical protein